MRRFVRGSWLIGTMVAVLIVLLLVMVWLFYRTSSQGSGASQKPLVNRIQETQGAAQGVECRNNLAQIRQALQMSQMGEEGYPQSLRDLKLSDTMLVCPVSKQPYLYDLASGRVQCQTPGHENY